MAREKIADTVLDAFKQGSKGETQFRKTLDDAIEGAKPKGAAGSPTYGTPAAEDWDKIRDGSALGSKGGMDQLSKFGSSFAGGIQRSAMAEGKTVMGMAGGHAIRGAAWGAVGGGTIESAQGGSFWDGAKQGAVNGAAGWTGYRMGMKGVGATSINPFAGKNQGLFSAGNTMMRSFSKDAEVSGQAAAILNNRQVSAVAQGVMNTRKGAAKKSE